MLEAGICPGAEPLKRVRTLTRLMLPFGGMVIGGFGIYDMAWLGGSALMPGAVLILAATLALGVSVLVDKMDQARRLEEKMVDFELGGRRHS